MAAFFFYSFRIRVYHLLGSVSCEFSLPSIQKKRVTQPSMYEKCHTIAVHCFSNKRFLFHNSQAPHDCLVYISLSSSTCAVGNLNFTMPSSCLRFTPLNSSPGVSKFGLKLVPLRLRRRILRASHKFRIVCSSGY